MSRPSTGHLRFFLPLGETLRRIITILLWGLLLTPLLITPDTLFPFQTGKGFLSRVLIEAAGFFYLWLALIDPSARPRRGPLLWSVLAFAGILLLTLVTSVDPYRSFWGDIERMEGVFGILHGVLLFVIAQGVFTSREDWIRYFRVSLIVSLAVTWYALAQMYPSFRFFSVYEIKPVQPGSTFGHHSFVATYAIFQIFFAAFLILMEKPTWRKLLASGALVLNIALLSFTGVRGAQVGLLAATTLGIVLTTVYAVKSRKGRIALGGSLLVVIAFVGIIFSLKDSALLRKFPYALQRLATISPDAAMAKTRLIALGVSWEAFKEKPILGWGQENFKIAYNRHFDPEYLHYEGGWFDRAHNKIAEVAVQAGAVGLIAYLSVFCFGLLVLLRFLRTRGSFTDMLLAVCVMALGTAYFVQNLFLFDTSTSHLMFFSSLAFATFLLNEEREVADAKNWNKSRTSGRTVAALQGRMVLVGAGTLTVCLIVYSNWIPYTTARLGRTALDANSPAQATARFEQALASGGFPTQEATVAMTEALITSGRSKQKEWAGVLWCLEQQFSDIVSRESTDPRMLIYLGKLCSDRGLTDPTYLDRAEQVLRKAITIVPTRPEGYQELGVTYLRRGEGEQGLQLFRKALELNVHNANAVWMLGIALASQKRFEEGIEHLESAMLGGYNWDNPADIGNLTLLYNSMNLTDRLVRLYELIVERHPENTGYRNTLAKAKSMMGEAAQETTN